MEPYETPMFEVDIDFDEASIAWMQNKKKIGTGSYTYVCGAPSRSKPGKFCKKDTMDIKKKKWLQRTPGSEYYNAGLRIPIQGEQGRCYYHRSIPIKK